METLTLSPMAKKRERKPGDPVAFRPEKEFEPKIQRAMKATGNSEGELAKMCFEACLDHIVRGVIKKRQRHAQPFLERGENHFEIP